MRRFNAAQEVMDVGTMWDVLYHTACQQLKNKVGSIYDWTLISDCAVDICLKILDRYRRNPDYRCKHSAAVHFALLSVVYGDRRKEDERDRRTVSLEVLDNI